MPSCYGFIILDVINKKTILVEAPSGNLSFPKGKFEKKKNSDKYACAIRELQEETGLTLDSIDVVPNIILNEYKLKNNDSSCSIQYYVGIIKDTNVEFTYDHEELVSVKWYDFSEIEKLDNFKDSRKKVFKELQSLLAVNNFDILQ